MKIKTMLIAALGTLALGLSATAGAHGGDWDGGGHWKHHHKHHYYGYGGYGPVFVERPVVVERYVVRRPPVVYAPRYYEPAYYPEPVYYPRRPAVTIGVDIPPLVIPLR